MSLQFQARSRFLELHLSTGLNDWDMNEEIKLTTTTDQFYHDNKRNDQYLVQWHYARISRRKEDLMFQNNHKSEKQVQPNLWLMVNPNLACSIKYPNVVKPPSPPKMYAQQPRRIIQSTSTLVQPRHIQKEVLPFDNACVDDSHHEAASSSEYMLTDEDDVSSVDVPVYRKAKNARKGKAVTKAGMRKLSLAQNKRLQRVLQDSKNLKSGAWPRPPVNYCILIAMALSSSRAGSLNVQQIYNFTREHFPFFQTAPDGWKNTIRHNLCFSNSFRKTPQQVCSEGKRKSCLWHLTLDGHRRLRDEIHTLNGESFRVLKRSMNNPDMIETLFAL